MKLVAVTRIFNEQDIVEAFSRHTAFYVDHHVFLDNGSVDGTLEILKKLKEEGLNITVYTISNVSFIEKDSLTFLYRYAVDKLNADWVLMLDADEFIDDRNLGVPVGDYLENLSAKYPDIYCIKVRLRDYVITKDTTDDLLVTDRMTECCAASDTKKVIVKADLVRLGAAIMPGSHSVVINGTQHYPSYHEQHLLYAHFPNRSAYQWISKFTIGWSRLLAGGPQCAASDHATHYRGPYELLRDHPARVLRSSELMELRESWRGALTHDPITYRGTGLRYTEPTDYPMRAVLVLMHHLDRLATSHGEAMEQIQALTKTLPASETTATKIL